MIILKHLTVDRFRLLRDVNLHFPQRGSILIQGPNEAGKSSLLESIYFALYGEPLAAGHLDDLVPYGAASASVTLTLSVGATELTVTRTIERGKGQNVVLRVQRLGMPAEEPITRPDAANQRIINELGQMDDEALRNSCFVEQKGLPRLENLRGVEREATARKILGLEKLMLLTEHFKVSPQDEQRLQDAAERLHLAEIQARIPELSEQLERIEAALDALRVAEDLQEIDQQQADIVEQEQALEQIQATRLQLKSRQTRIQQLKKADATLVEIIAAYDGIAEARRRLPDLEKQIAELERREREELPALEKRVADLAELTRSFGTLQRMSNDLLVAVDTIKDLEQELKQHNEVKDDLQSVEEQVAHARSRVAHAQQALHDLEERRRAGRPKLEARLENMKTLSERLKALRQVEDRYQRSLKSKQQAEENKQQLASVQKELRETEQELARVEAEAKQIQQQTDAQEKRWRQLGMRRQLEEWQRLKGLSQGLADAEQHVRLAYQHQEKLNLAVMEARAASRKHMMIFATCIVLFFCLAITALVLFQHTVVLAAIAGVAALVFVGVGGVSFQSYRKAHDEEQIADRQMQEAINRVGIMVAARETAIRMGGSHEALLQIEREIQSLGGSVPRSVEEAQQILQQTKDQDESLSDLQQQQMKEKLEEASAARNQINVTMEAVARLRKERARLEEQRKRGDWEHIEERLEADQAAVERMQQEITVLAGQEGLPLPSINDRLQGSTAFDTSSSDQQAGGQTGIPELEALVESTIRATEREIASLDGKLDLVTDFAAQVKIHQDALDVLLARQKVIQERNERYQTSNPALQIERAREQQAALRQALQSLQDSLRQRVKPLDIPFGQAAISNAETTARKQLEELQITLGTRIVLQEQHAKDAAQLKELQESLSEYYKQLAKLSNSLGGWIMPLNPFADALSALRTRCQRELEEADEAGIEKELEALRNREGAAKAKIELCRQEIEFAQERIATMLTQRNRPPARSYTLADIVTIWPLVGEHSLEDRPRLEDERETLEQELTSLEEQELALSTQLQTGGTRLDLEQARLDVEQQERSYQTKKRGNMLVKAVSQRLMRKVISRTEYYIQQILPLLTGGRYHDVHLVMEPEEGAAGGPFQLRVWDSAAGEYVPRSSLSGGAADQLSLALRLAFAIAILPRELNAAPGFVMLDEPLSSFDRGRTQSLVDVVTGEMLGQHFEQILLVSHSNAFDPALFPYHIYMDNGVVVESNLPVVPGLPAAEMNGKSADMAHLVMSKVAPARVGAE
jgi:DNA repair exonuclease SbcCD ATPase subunit